MPSAAPDVVSPTPQLLATNAAVICTHTHTHMRTHAHGCSVGAPVFMFAYAGCITCVAIAIVIVAVVVVVVGESLVRFRVWVQCTALIGATNCCYIANAMVVVAVPTR